MYSEDIEQFRQDFYKAYYDKVRPIANKYELERFLKMILVIIAFIIATALGVFLIWGLIITGRITAIRVILVLFSAAIFVYTKLKKNLEQKLKTKVMPIIEKSFGAVTWIPEGYEPDVNLYWQVFEFNKYSKNKLNCMLNGENYIYWGLDDVFTGKYKGVEISIMEIALNWNSNRDRNMFDGIIIELAMNKSFSGHTIVNSASFTHKSPSANLKKTKLEDVEFNKKYDVFTDDEVEARYILTPKFMEKIKDIKFAFNAKKIRCAFCMDKFFIAIPTKKDMFSICNLFKPVADFKQFRQLCEQFVSILSLIDHFELDKKL